MRVPTDVQETYMTSNTNVSFLFQPAFKFDNNSLQTSLC